jgi:predicted PurR-regulated permease PerM
MSFDLLKHASLLVLVIVGWFALASLTDNLIAKVILGWVGFGIVALYYRWLRKNKVRPSSSVLADGEPSDQQRRP